MDKKNYINLARLPDKSKEYLRYFCKKFNINEIGRAIDSLKNLRVLIMGDPILDEYVYCDFMERTSKDPLIATKFRRADLWVGGVFAIANQISNFTDNLTLLTSLGKNHRGFIKKRIRNNIKKVFLEEDLEKTIIKRRYIDFYRKRKLFEIYNTNRSNLSRNSEEKIIKFLDKNLSNFDIIIISDFGHGLLTPKIREKIQNKKISIALNTQLNGGNLGYNFITNYHRAEFVLLNERELRLPLQEENGEISEVVEKLRENRDFRDVYITLGKNGAYYSVGKGSIFGQGKVPSFTESSEDTTGCGDVSFSISSLLNNKKVNFEITLFLGNLMGAMHSQIIGNEKQISKSELKEEIHKLFNECKINASHLREKDDK